MSSSSYSENTSSHLSNSDLSVCSCSSTCSIMKTKIIIEHIHTFIKSKEDELCLDNYPDNTNDSLEVEYNSSHVEKIKSEVYLISSVDTDSVNGNNINTRMDLMI